MGEGRTFARVAALALALCCAWPASAPAKPVSGPHETIDNVLSTTRPNAPTGFSFTGTYHAAGDPAGDPPYMRRMISYPPRGMRYDTAVPDRCTADDIELALSGTSACPPGSVLGKGTVVGKFMGQFNSTLDVDFINNDHEQIILARSPGVASVARGKIHPDGSVEFASPTCYPTVQPAGCPVDNVLQMKSVIAVKPYTRTIHGVSRSYMTTAPTCPAARVWRMPIRLWWADGSVDTVVVEEPCTRPRSPRRCSRKQRARHRRSCRRASRRRHR